MAITKLKGTQIFDGTITSANIDDGLEKEFTKVRVTTGDSSPDFLSSKILAGDNITINVLGSSGSIQYLAITGSAGGGTPAGNNQQIQFNNGGAFGASGNFKFDSANNVLSLTGSFGMKGNVTPDADTTYDLGSSDKRWANVYTGDLHLRNDRGDWTIVEERDYLCVVNNITGKKYKMMLQPLDD